MTQRGRGHGGGNIRLWALGLLRGPNKKNRTHYQEIFAKGKAISFFIAWTDTVLNDLVTQRSQAELEGRGREGEQAKLYKLGDRNPPELGPLREK